MLQVVYCTSSETQMLNMAFTVVARVGNRQDSMGLFMSRNIATLLINYSLFSLLCFVPVVLLSCSNVWSLCVIECLCIILLIGIFG